ncbi:DET1 family protein [Megaselia abdita]
MEDEDLISAKRRKVSSENIQHLLFDRENGLRRHKISNRKQHQDFYKCITPNLSVLSVDAPTIFLRKFTQDGRYLLAFSQDQSSLLVYEFLGTAKAAELVSSNQYDVCLKQKRNTRLPNNLIDNKIHKNIFNTLFKQRQNIYVNFFSNKQLSRECSLFTADGDHVILGGSSIIPEDRRPSFYDIYLTNDTIAELNPEDYVIVIVNFKKGEVTDTITFNADKIHLSNNHGIYLYKNSFAVLSILHQTIYTYEILNGQFTPVNVIGQFCNEDDRMLYNKTYPAAFHRPSKEVTLNSMKQRILSFLYQQAKDTKDYKERAFNIRKFYQWFDLV